MDDRPPITESELSLKATDGAPLSARVWSRPGPRGLLVIAHGFGEHGGAYRELAETLASNPGLDVIAGDQRGHGRSGGRRGIVRRHSDLTLDLMATIDWARRERPGLPTFLLGHSNGGLVAIDAVLRGALGLSGLILSNPSLRLSAHVPIWKRAAAEVLRRFAPWVTLDSGLRDADLTGDPTLLAEIVADPLRHGRISPPFYFGMLAAGPVALARAPEIVLPTLVVLGGADTVIDPDSGREFFERLGSADKTLKVYPEMKHEPLNERGRDRVIVDIASWVGEWIGRAEITTNRVI